ncbi:zinc-dependent peptidase [Undibacterium arcticum]
MTFILLTMLLMLGIGLLFWLPKFRLQRAIARPFPRHYAQILRMNVPVFTKNAGRSSAAAQAPDTTIPAPEKKFVGCDGLTITDEIRVTIAGKACLLLLNRATRVYPDLAFILVYPSAFIVPRSEVAAGGLVTRRNDALLGESWSDDRVILAWDHVKRSNADLGVGHEVGHDVVLHEFAHQLDSESGSTNGAPYLMSRARYERWSAVFFCRSLHSCKRLHGISP